MKRRDLFYMYVTKQGKTLTLKELEANLRTIIDNIMDKEDPDTPSTSYSQDKQHQKNELKKKNSLPKFHQQRKERKDPFLEIGSQCNELYKIAVI